MPRRKRGTKEALGRTTKAWVSSLGLNERPEGCMIRRGGKGIEISSCIPMLGNILVTCSSQWGQRTEEVFLIERFLRPMVARQHTHQCQIGPAGLSTHLCCPDPSDTTSLLLSSFPWKPLPTVCFPSLSACPCPSPGRLPSFLQTSAQPSLCHRTVWALRRA